MPHYNFGYAAKIHREYGRECPDDKSAANTEAPMLQLGELHNIAKLLEVIADEVVPERKARRAKEKIKQDFEERINRIAFEFRHKWSSELVECAGWKYYVNTIRGGWDRRKPDYREPAPLPLDPIDKAVLFRLALSRARKSATTKIAQFKADCLRMGVDLA